MSIWEEFLADRGGGVTRDVASVLAGVALPSIEPFGSDSEVLVGLPWSVPLRLPHPVPLSVVGVARGIEVNLLSCRP